jgi:hypothetical protein
LNYTGRSLALRLLIRAVVKLQVHVRERRNSVQAFCPDLPGCSASATTEAEALSLLRARVDEYFSGRPSVLPGTRVIQLEV